MYRAMEPPPVIEPDRVKCPVVWAIGGGAKGIHSRLPRLGLEQVAELQRGVLEVWVEGWKARGLGDGRAEGGVTNALVGLIIRWWSSQPATVSVQAYHACCHMRHGGRSLTLMMPGVWCGLGNACSKDCSNFCHEHQPCLPCTSAPFRFPPLSHFGPQEAPKDVGLATAAFYAKVQAGEWPREGGKAAAKAGSSNGASTPTVSRL